MKCRKRVLSKPFIKKGCLHFALIFSVATLVLLIFRSCFFTQVEVIYERPDLSLLSGDHVLVNRLSYGLRLPFSYRWRYRRLGECNPLLGELVVYDYPDGSGRIGLDRVNGVPGDTIWLEDDPDAFVVVPVGSVGLGPLVVSERSIIGKPVCVSYSVDRSRPVYAMFRPHRFFIGIK